jgi:hypothetical protein
MLRYERDVRAMSHETLSGAREERTRESFHKSGRVLMKINSREHGRN